MVVQKNTQDGKLQKDLAKRERSGDKAYELALNAVARYRSLMAMGTTAPAIYPTDYFAPSNSWVLKRRDDIHQDSGITASQNTVSLRVGSIGDNMFDSSAIMNGASALKANQSDVNIKVLKFNDHGFYVESADVLVTGQFTDGGVEQKLNMKFRVPLPPPQPSAPILKYKIRGTSDPYMPVTGNLSGLRPDVYLFRAFGSGIALGARILIEESAAPDGDSSDPMILGVKNGQITHTARTYDAVEVPIGGPVEVDLSGNGVGRHKRKTNRSAAGFGYRLESTPEESDAHPPSHTRS